MENKKTLKHKKELKNLINRLKTKLKNARLANQSKHSLEIHFLEKIQANQIDGKGCDLFKKSLKSVKYA